MREPVPWILQREWGVGTDCIDLKLLSLQSSAPLRTTACGRSGLIQVYCMLLHDCKA